MHKLLKADISLVLLTTCGLLYLYLSSKITMSYVIILFFIYVSAKIIGYIILPYNKFDIFLTNLTENSKLSFLSGFEIFKTVLVALLFLGFILIDPSIWIIESILVVMMRVWGLSYINKNSPD